MFGPCPQDIVIGIDEGQGCMGAFTIVGEDGYSYI